MSAVEIVDGDHAARVLESFVKQGKALVKGITTSDWAASPACTSTEGKHLDACITGGMGQVICNFYPVEDYDFEKDEPQHTDDKETAWNNAVFAAAAFELIPGMIAGVEAVLEPTMTHTENGKKVVTARMANDDALIALAKAYAPRMVTLRMKVPRAR